MKKPKRGDVVEVDEVYPLETTYIGIVRDLLSEQFTYQVDDQIRYCMYKGSSRWRVQEWLSL